LYSSSCGSDDAGSCHGGYHTSTYEFIKKVGFIPYDTCQPYIACSSESTDGFCSHVDTECKIHRYEDGDDGAGIVIDPSSMNNVWYVFEVSFDVGRYRAVSIHD